MADLKKFAEEQIDITDCMWYKNGELIGEGYTYSAGPHSTDLLESGAIYTFEVYTNNLDTLISTPKIFNITPPVEEFKVYPNPVSQGQKLTIEGATAGKLIEVYNMNGACVSRTLATGEVTELTLALPAGIYMVRNNNKETKVLIK